MKTLFCISLLLALVMTAAAADLTGKWSGTISVLGDDGTPGSPNAVYMVAKQTGTTLTGTGGPDENEQWPIQNGKVVGNKLTAQVTSPDGVVYTLTMTVDSDQISGDCVVTQGGQSFKAKIQFTRIK